MTKAELREALSKQMATWGARGGKARAKNLTAAELSAIGKKAAAAQNRQLSCECGACLTCKNREAMRKYRAKRR